MSPVDLLQNVKQGKPFTFSNYFFLYSMDFTSSVSMWHMSTSVSTMKNFPILFAFRSCTRRLLQFISFILVLYCCLKSYDALRLISCHTICIMPHTFFNQILKTTLCSSLLQNDMMDVKLMNKQGRTKKKRTVE